MGMLNRLANAVGEIGEKVFDYNLKKMSQEDELKMREEIEMNKEKRIYEQWQKQHDILRGEAMTDEVAKYKREDDPNRLTNRKTQAELDKSDYELQQLKDPNSVHNQDQLLGLAAKRAQIGASNASTERSRTETGMLSKKDALFNMYRNEQDPEKRNQILNDLTVLENKDPYALQKSKLEAEQAQKLIDLTEKAADPSISQEQRQSLLDEIQLRTGKKDSAGSMKVIAVGTGETDVVSGKEITRNYIAQQDKKGNVNIIDPKSMLPTSFVNQDAASKKAAELVDLEMNAEGKVKPEVRSWATTPVDQSRDGEFKALKEYEKERNSRVAQKTLELMGVDKHSSNGGMVGKATAGNVSNKETPVKLEDETAQKQADILFGVIKRNESGGKGVNAGTPKATADNPHPTAEGTYQMIDKTAKAYGAKADANGDISPAEKDRVAGEYYKDIYNKLHGDQSAVLAAGFGQDEVIRAKNKALKEGGEWWSYIEHPAIKNNMPEIVERAEESIMKMSKEGVRVPSSLLKFYGANKSLKNKKG